MTRSSLSEPRTAIHVAHRGDLRGAAIQQVDAAAEGSDPQSAELVFGERGDVAIAETFLALARMWPNDQVRGFHFARPPDLVPIHSEPPRSSNSDTM